MSDANKRQEGGDHYKQDGSKPEHWDLAIMYRWDPFQYQITKYVMRWKDKHSTREKRLEDLKKARHFLDKYIENYEAYDDHKPLMTGMTVTFPPGYVPLAMPVAGGEHSEPRLASSPLNSGGRVSTTMQADSDERFQNEGFYGDNTQLYKCRVCKKTERYASLADAHEKHSVCELAETYLHIP